MRILLSAVLFVFLLVPNTAQAQSGNVKVAVSVSHSGQDSVGRQLAFAVREAVRASSGYSLVLEADSDVQVAIVTVDPEGASASGSYWTVGAVSYTMTNFLPVEKGNPQTWYPLYLTTQVMTVGTQRVSEQARAVMATLDECLDKYRRQARL